MKLELKNIKVLSANSQETECFNATLYVDGKRLASISNDGWGGPNRVYPVKGPFNAPEFHAKLKEIDTYLNKTDAGRKYVADFKRNYGMDTDYDLEGWVGEQVNKHLLAKDLRRLLRGKIIFTDPAKSGLRMMGFKNCRKVDSRHIDYFRDKHPDATILNEMSFDDALEIFAKAA